MEYDPIKKFIGNFFSRKPFSVILFYKLLDLLLLRSWHIHKELRKWSKNHIGEKRVLDAGSGFGQYTYWLAKIARNVRINAIDVNIDQIEDCKNFISQTKFASRVVFEHADLTDYHEIEKYDLILTVDVMEHIVEDALVFENFHKSLKPGGLLLISTPSDKGGSDVLTENQSSFIGEHVRNGYGIDEIKNKLSVAGFSSVYAAYTYGFPGKISWKLSMKLPVLLLNYSKLLILILPVYYLMVYPICFLLNFIDVNIIHKTGTGLIVKAIK